MNQKPYNKCLINLVCSVCSGKDLPSVFLVQTSLLRRSVCTKTTGKYFPVQISDSVNKLSVYYRDMGDTYHLTFHFERYRTDHLCSALQFEPIIDGVFSNTECVRWRHRWFNTWTGDRWFPANCARKLRNRPCYRCCWMTRLHVDCGTPRFVADAFTYKVV